MKTGTRTRRTVLAAEVVLWCTAAALLGCYACVYVDRSAYQAFQAWSFDRALEGRSASVPGFALHMLAGGGTAAGMPASKDSGTRFAWPKAPGAARERQSLAAGAPIGRIEIPRVGVRAMIVNGTTDRDLRRAVGHIEGTPLFGSGGNVGLAGHRDTFFRGLRDIRRGDRIEVRTLQGTYLYTVDATEIVLPNDTEVLNASGRPTLTLVTCFPFDYVGSAPRRFIVEASEVAGPVVTPRPPRGS